TLPVFSSSLSFLSHLSSYPRYLPSFPTRRSSDLYILQHPCFSVQLCHVHRACRKRVDHPGSAPVYFQYGIGLIGVVAFFPFRHCWVRITPGNQVQRTVALEKSLDR